MSHIQRDYKYVRKTWKNAKKLANMGPYDYAVASGIETVGKQAKKAADNFVNDQYQYAKDKLKESIHGKVKHLSTKAKRFINHIKNSQNSFEHRHEKVSTGSSDNPNHIRS